MRVGVLVHDLHGGGAEAVARSWAAGLEALGHDVVFLVYGPGAGEVSDDGIRVSRFPARGTVARWTVLPWWVRREGSRLRLDVLLSVLDFSNLVALLAAADGAHAVVISEHTVPTLHWRRKGVSGLLKYAAARLLYRRADRAVAVSHAVATDLRARLAVPGERVVVLPNPVPVAAAEAPTGAGRSPAGHGTGRRRLLVVGRCVPEKRMDRALAVLAELRRRDPDWTCCIIGDGPARAMLEARARRDRLPVEFSGWVTPWQSLAQPGDVLLLTSDYEGFGNVLVEAAGAGVPSVAPSSALGVADAMLPEVTGVLATSNTTEELAEAVLRAADLRLTDPAVRGWLGRFGAEVAARRLADVLQRAQASRRSRRRVTHVGPAPDAQGGISSVLRTYRDLRVPGWDQRFLTSYVAGERAWSAASTARALARMALTRARSLGVVHVHLSQRGSFVREGGLAVVAAVRRLPVVVTVHGSGFAGFLDRHRALVTGVLKRADVIVLLAADHRDLLTPELRQRVVLVPNTVGGDTGSPAPVPARPCALFAGELSTRKGVDVLLEAWPRVRSAVPDAELVLAGPAGDLAPALPDGAQWLGAVANSEVRSLLRSCRVAVLPSRREAMPMFILEAMLAGRPVVSTPVGAIPETVGHAGVIVPVGDAQALANAMVELLRPDGPAEQLGRAARERFDRRYAPGATLQRLAESYAAALLPARAGAGPRRGTEGQS